MGSAQVLQLAAENKTRSIASHDCQGKLRRRAHPNHAANGEGAPEGAVGRRGSAAAAARLQGAVQGHRY
jgi:hypothetical protein